MSKSSKNVGVPVLSVVMVILGVVVMPVNGQVIPTIDSAVPMFNMDSQNAYILAAGEGQIEFVIDDAAPGAVRPADSEEVVGWAPWRPG